eukprot:TRINITY_DN88_c0_g1_i2.p2 TRINITY_DN88_c0_g1~~TRINITY_DN88_c0_g1_i2.p2  ORF type:complete len:125 (-),score=31.98 TRINITY_DN88_c0_g1_i2:390-764(-)
MPNVSVWVSADCDSPNFLIKMWCADWMSIAHVRRRVNEVLSLADDWDGDGEFCVALAPVWGDGFEYFCDDDMLFELDGWDGDDDDQALVAITEGCDMDFWGEFDWCESDEVIIVEMYDEFDPYE